jgi:hypothetical protein
MKNIEKNLDTFLGNKTQPNKNVKVEEEGFEEVCDKDTGECTTVKSKDGLIERVNKKIIVEDGRSLLMD